MWVDNDTDNNISIGNKPSNHHVMVKNIHVTNYSMYCTNSWLICLIRRATHLKQNQRAIWWCKTPLACGPLQSNRQLSIRVTQSSSALMWLENGYLSRQKASNGALNRTLYSPAGHQVGNFSRCCCITSLHQSEHGYCCSWDMNTTKNNRVLLWLLLW